VGGEPAAEKQSVGAAAVRAAERRVRVLCRRERLRAAPHIPSRPRLAAREPSPPDGGDTIQPVMSSQVGHDDSKTRCAGDTVLITAMSVTVRRETLARRLAALGRAAPRGMARPPVAAPYRRPQCDVAPAAVRQGSNATIFFRSSSKQLTASGSRSKNASQKLGAFHALGASERHPAVGETMTQVMGMVELTTSNISSSNKAGVGSSPIMRNRVWPCSIQTLNT